MNAPEQDTTIVDGPRDRTADRLLARFAIDVRVDFGAATHLGKVRKKNEDRFAVVRRTRAREVLITNVPLDDVLIKDEHAYVAVVADGMGGEPFGDLASDLAIRTIWDFASQLSSWVMRTNPHVSEEIQERIDAYAEYIHRTFAEHAKESPLLLRMGTTLTSAYTMGAEAIIANIGDSRAYLLRGNEVRQITRDHTVAQELMDAGVSAARTKPYRHCLTRCLNTTAADVNADIFHLTLQNGDRLMLCSDGLSDLVDDSSIGKTCGEHPVPQDAANALVQAALDAGGKDNVTVVIAKYEFPNS